MVSARKRERKKKFPGGKKKSQTKRARKRERLDSFLLTSADSALVVGCSLVRRGCRAARVHRFVSPFAHLFLGLFVRLMTIEFAFFFLLFWKKSERDQREKGSDFPSKLCETKRLYNNNTHLYKIFCHLSTRVKLKNAQS